jgi:hypothetical protein
MYHFQFVQQYEEKPNRKRPLGLDARISLKWISEKQAVKTELVQVCEHSDDHLGSNKNF